MRWLDEITCTLLTVSEEVSNEAVRQGYQYSVSNVRGGY